MTLQLVELEQLTLLADAPPKPTVVLPAVALKFVPVTVTGVPPAEGPLVGQIPLTVGIGGPG